MVSLDLFIVRSWDGNNTTFGPDEWRLSVDGALEFRTTFAFFGITFVFFQAFPEEFPGGNFPGGTGASEISTLGYFDADVGGPADSVYTLSFTVPHSDPNAVISFQSVLRGFPDEFWGMDNVTVDLVTDPSGTGPLVFDSPPGDFSALVRNAGGTFTRTLKNGTRFEYDADGLQTAAVDRNGNTTSYAYDGNGLLTSITDPVGLVTTLAYTGGLLTSVTDPASRVTSFEHDAAENLIKIVDPDLSERLFAYDERHRMTAQTSKRGFVTTYDYGPHGRLVQSNLPDGSNRQLAAAQVAGVIDVSSGEGTQANPAPLTRPEDVAATFTDGNGNTSTTELDHFGAATSITDALARVTTTERDADGKPTRSVAPNGRVSEMTYGERGNLLTLTEAVGDPLERTSSFEYELVFNQLTEATDPRGNPTTFAYDANGNLTTVTDAALTQTVMAYADANCVGQVTNVTRAAGLPEESITTFAYDPVTCNLTSAVDSLANSTAYQYDTAGNLTQVTDAESRTKRFIHDELNRVVKSIDATNSDPAPTCAMAGVTCLDYDAAGNLIALTDANDNVTSFDYDERERLISRTDPLLNTGTVSYDGDGNVRFTTDRKGQTIEFRYDLANRLIKKILQPGAPEELVRHIAYDVEDNVISVVDWSSSLTFTYDFLNRVKTASTAGSPFQPDVLLTVNFDANDNRRTLDDPVGQSVFTYDSLNRLIELATPTLPAQPFIFSYDVLSRRTGISLPNGVDTSIIFDSAGRLTDISHVLGGSSTISDFAYGHNLVGNRSSVTQTRSAATVNGTLSYVYDELNRLVQATNPQVGAPDETFTYDPVGNRLNRDGQAVDSVFGAGNQLIEDERFCYEYDLNGNLESKTAKMAGACTGGETAYSYDAENRLTQIDFPEGTVATYQYDGFWRRVSKQVNGTPRQYVYDSQNILLEYDGAGALLARHTHGPGEDDPLLMEQDLDASGTFTADEQFFVHVDGLGSVTEVTDQNGSVIDTFVYDSYGRFVQRPATPVSDLFTFTSRQFDEESGLYYYRARYYDPGAGNFTQPDPVGLAAGDENLYRYTLSNPINLVVPDGLSATPTGFSIKSSSAAQPLPPIDQLKDVTVSPDFIALIIAQCAAPTSKGGTTEGRSSLQSKLARSNNKFTPEFGLQPYSNPTQEQTTMVATGILTSPNLQISSKKRGGNLSEGGFLLRMNGPKSPGIALDTQFNFQGFMN